MAGKRFSLPFAVALLAACAAASPEYPVTPFGPGQYVVYVDSSNESKARRVAAQTANAYCQERGWGMIPQNVGSKSRHNGWLWVYEVEFVFECVAPPESLQPPEDKKPPEPPEPPEGTVPL